MMNQFAAAAANKNDEQHELRRPTGYDQPTGTHVPKSTDVPGPPGPSHRCLLDPATTATPGSTPATSPGPNDGLAPPREQAVKHYRSVGATQPANVWGHSKVRQVVNCSFRLQEEPDEGTQGTTR